MPLDAEKIAGLRRLMEKATQGPWQLLCGNDGEEGHGGIATEDAMIAHYEDECPTTPDAALIVAMRNTLPDLLACAERVTGLEAQLAASRELFQGHSKAIDYDKCLSLVHERDSAVEGYIEVQKARDAARAERDAAVATVAKLRDEMAKAIKLIEDDANWQPPWTFPQFLVDRWIPALKEALAEREKL